MDHGNVEFEGKNLDVAIWKASQELGIPIEKLRYAILSHGKRGPGGVSLEPDAGRRGGRGVGGGG